VLQPTTIQVLLRDAFGNPVDSPDESVNIVVAGANDVRVVGAYSGNASYSATYVPALAGEDHVALTLNGSAISGSPYKSTVSP
jgi:hypothetical protein